jgi:lipoate-protein ligase A
MFTINLYPYEILPGPLNMAADDVRLDRAVSGAASLRFYGWREPTLSLGYFQPFAARLADPLLKSLPVVRRSTGGGAIVHHRELTYGLALPAPMVGPEPWGCRMHHLIADVLRSFGVDSDPVVCGEEQKADPFLCFHHHTAGDLAVGPRPAARRKIVGSAQRKQHGAILQHGSILLATSEYAPTLPGAFELSGVRVDPEPLAERIANAFAKNSGWDLVATDWTPEDRAGRRRVADEKYASPAWTEKR